MQISCGENWNQAKWCKLWAASGAASVELKIIVLTLVECWSLFHLFMSSTQKKAAAPHDPINCQNPVQKVPRPVTHRCSCLSFKQLLMSINPFRSTPWLTHPDHVPVDNLAADNCDSRLILHASPVALEQPEIWASSIARTPVIVNANRFCFWVPLSCSTSVVKLSWMTRSGWRSTASCYSVSCDIFGHRQLLYTV